MKRQRQAPAGRKQLAFELGECHGRLADRVLNAGSKASEIGVETGPSNIICFSVETAQQERLERGVHYANIVALAKHLA